MAGDAARVDPSVPEAPSRSDGGAAHRASIAALVALAAGCSNVATGVVAEDASIRDAATVNDSALLEQPVVASVPPVTCEDQDHDGFGRGLTCRGPDCDDRNPTITNQCYACVGPDNVVEGCMCSPGMAPLPCDLITGRSAAGPNGICHLGQRNCAPKTSGSGWSWGTCERWRNNFRYVGPISACPGSCLPTCRHQVICPTEADPLPAGSLNLRTAGSVPAVFCPAGTSDGGLTSMCTSTRCERGVYTRIFDGDCTPPTASAADPFYHSTTWWGQFNYSSNVPVGTSIHFEVRTGNTIADLATTRVVQLPDAPLGAPTAPTSLDLRAILRAASQPTDGRWLWTERYLRVTAYLNPSADGAVAPTLISTEIQYVCSSGE